MITFILNASHFIDQKVGKENGKLIICQKFGDMYIKGENVLWK